MKGHLFNLLTILLQCCENLLGIGERDRSLGEFLLGALELFLGLDELGMGVGARAPFRPKRLLNVIHLDLSVLDLECPPLRLERLIVPGLVELLAILLHFTGKVTPLAKGVRRDRLETVLFRLAFRILGRKQVGPDPSGLSTRNGENENPYPEICSMRAPRVPGLRSAMSWTRF